jgi:deoxycytidine triphosphate deaminase
MNCLLPDHEIEARIKDKRLIIKPFSGKTEPASYDLRMGNRVISITQGEETNLKDGDRVVVHPGELILIESLEEVGFPADLQGRICSKVSWLKKGLSSIATKVDPGYGYPTGWHLLLVFHHCGHEPIELSPGMPICSLEIEQLTEEAEKPYAGKEPKTVFLTPIEKVDPLSRVQQDFSKLKKEELEKFYGHPLDDLFLAIGSLQDNVRELQNRLPKPRPFWKTAVLAYTIFFVICFVFSLFLHIGYPSLVGIDTQLTVYGIVCWRSSPMTAD